MDSFDGYLPNLLTPKEVKVFRKRYQIIQLLRTKLSYREIAQKMGISTTTVVRLNQRLKVRKTKKKKSGFKNKKPEYLKKASENLKQSSEEIGFQKIPWKLG